MRDGSLSERTGRAGALHAASEASGSQLGTFYRSAERARRDPDSESGALSTDSTHSNVMCDDKRSGA